ncbi:hypothetical protein B0H14DRAFT_3037766 [Mycena olivaceomarginata]|nr:hypothetical protein B0H14DRAFT_3037766 [Mycena olivaceomarginata]
MLHLGYWWCFLVLHQPFISRRAQPIQHPDREVDHVKLCARAAENILELVETWQSLYTLRLVPVTMVQVVFNAGIIFLLRALQATASPRIAHLALNTALAQAETCVQYLHEAILNDRLRPIIARRLSHKGEQIPTVTLSSSSPPPEKPVPSFAGEPIVAGVLSTMPAPTYTTSTLASNALSVQNWPQSIDFFTQLQNVPAASAFGAESLYPGGGFADVDMTALLPNIDYFGAPELWEQPEFNGLWEEALNFGALDDDRTAAADVLFS